MKGKLITFEGSEGCGKSTQSRRLYEYLKKRKKKVIYLREPGATKVSEKIRTILLDAKNNAMLAECETLLYMAARSQIVGEIIKPKLEKGGVVICDRFLDSTLAYQGYGLGIDIDFIRCIGKFATFGIKPDLTIFLDLPVNKGLMHRYGCCDRIEKRPLSYHLRVRNGYLKLAGKDSKRIKIVRVEKDKNNTQKRIRKLVEKYAF
ncbi:MAG: dTMP kinase [Candidatus Omnitrophica bacterium]|nr:dTMP kinase [Candidatus Omnitrophota bacterium]